VPRSTAEDHVLADEETALLQAALARLSHRHREVVLLVELSGLSGVEAADALGAPAGTIWRRLHEARALLRVQLKGRLM
jgi:RNA polymerase sigma-70 factor (ECF subfamily)